MVMMSEEEDKKEYLEKAIRHWKRAIRPLLKKCSEETKNGCSTFIPYSLELDAVLNFLKYDRMDFESVGGTYKLSRWEREKVKLENQFENLESATFCISGLGHSEKRTIRQGTGKLWQDREKICLEISLPDEVNNPTVTVMMPQTWATIIEKLKDANLALWPREKHDTDINDGIQWSLSLKFKGIKKQVSWYAKDKFPPCFCWYMSIFGIDSGKWNFP